MLGGCRPAAALSPGDAARLAGYSEGAGDLGTLVYRGAVFAPDDPLRPRLSYERRVRRQDGALVSTHLTRRRSGEPMLIHRATHSEAYALERFEVLSAQTGLAGSMEVGASEVTFTVTSNGRTSTRTEPFRGPVVVGPTLFGVALQHWDALVDGQSVPVRFAVVERLRTYPFTLRLVSADAETTRFELRADGLLVRASVPPMRITFDSQTRRVIRYEGRVPPKDDARGGRDLDARVEYTFLVDRYR